jgi:hypothetical protein
MIKQNQWDLLDLGPPEPQPVSATDGALPSVLGVES